jgi:Bifunctional DNA primase/polymerase, N-terminal
MTGTRLRQALACAVRGWPVFPCRAGQKTPATTHGHLDATTDPAQITAWFRRPPGWNLAIATGAPGPDVLDVDQHGPAGNGYAAFARLSKAGLLDGAAAYVRTPSGGLHAYFTGSAQRNAICPLTTWTSGPPGGIWATWPGGSPPRSKGTATRACSGPPTAPWTPTPPPTSARWPPPPARPA